ncbi:hypothetical protein [Parasitella parasitica]|uniref:Ion transport domain-containing protein n=1 Tax=Parasitella parasitica TaxID=35722 RepID=A0A0B7N5J7_9FUNG|nr:hypothetical protein [Parasitella parasitica]
MSSPSSSIRQFNSYRFGEQIATSHTTNSQESVRQSRNSYSNDSVSPLQSIILPQDQGQYVQPLTRDMLEKKDRLDILLSDLPTTGTRVIQRRRSISNGNIARHLYNEDNSPMTFVPTFEKMGSEDSDASINSPNSQYEARFGHDFSRRNLKRNRSKHNRHHHHRHHKYHHPYPASRASSSIEKTNKSLNNSNRDRSYGSITNKKQSTNSRSVNTSHASGNSNDTSHQRQPGSSGPPRRFSGLVRLSAAHIALNRTKKNKKRHHQSTIYTILHKLSTVASRVVDSRVSEPADTKMSIEELSSLSRYLYVLKSGHNKHESSDSEDDNTSISNKDGRQTPFVTPKQPIIGLFVEEMEDDSNTDQVAVATTDDERQDETSPLLTPPQKSIRKRNLSSLGNIFPFAPISRMPSISRSGSESSQINSTATEADRLLPLPPTSPPQAFSRSGKLSKFIKMITLKFSQLIKHLCRPVIHLQQYQYREDHDIQFRFEGWSLFIFSPTSSTRLYLWKIVGSRFELVSKIIVYGLILNTHSHFKPSIQSWFNYIRNIRRKPSFFSVIRENDFETIIPENEGDGEEDDNTYHYTRQYHRQSLLPPFAHTPRSRSSTTASIISSTERIYPNYAAHSLSTSSNVSEPPSSSLASPAETTDNTNMREPSSPYLDDLEPTYDNCPAFSVPKNQYKRVERVESEDAKSILSTAEQQVLASLNPYTSRAFSTKESGVEFLKVTHRSFLSSFANIIDLISVTSYWIDFITVLYLSRRPYPIFQAFAATRLLRLLVITEGTSVIMKSLGSSFDMLKNVLGFFAFFWLLFSLAALFIFMNAFSRRCAVWPEKGLHPNLVDIQYVEPRISCSGYMISANERTGPYDINTGTQNKHPGGDGLFCKLGQVCIQDVANQPEYGYMSYENIFYTMLNILTVISTENWTDLLYITQDSVSSLGAAVFYSFCIYLMTFIMIPMFIAVITSSFSHIRGDMRESAFSSTRKARLLLASGKRKNTYNNHQQQGHGDQIHEEWIYEGTGLGGHFQTRSLIQDWAHFITHHAYFPYVGSILVVLNVIAMMFYSADMSVHDKAYYDLVGKIYTFIFGLEILVRIYGCMHWRQFWQRIRNRVDLVIVIATVLDEFPFSDAVGDGQGILNLTFFTFLVLLLLSPMSVQLFGGDFKFVGQDEPSMRFDNSYQAFLALFQIMTGENWTDILYDAMHSQEKASVSYAAIYMIFLYFSVHYMVLNLFIAVIMENFDLDEDEIKQIQIKKYIREHRWKPELLLPLFIIQDKKKLDFKNIPQNLVAHVTSSKFKDFLGQDGSSSDESSPYSPTQRANRNLPYFSLHTSVKNASRPMWKKPRSILSQKSAASERRVSVASQYSSHSLRLDAESSPYIDRDEEPLVKYGDEYEINVARENKAVIVENLNVFRSIIVLKKDNVVRLVCIHLVNAESYNWCIVGLISLSTLLALWADKSNREDHPVLIYSVIEPIHALLLLVYWIDVFIHMVADGVFMLPKSYMRNAWNLLDMVNLTCQIVLTVLGITCVDSLERMTAYGGYLRILRTLRSMRIVYYVHGMRVIFLDLVYGLPKMIDAIALNFLVFLPFAIYGCYLFSGRFFICNDDDIGSRQACSGEFQSTDDDNFGILLPRTWKNPYDYSFDTFGKALLHLFECASGEGWILSLFTAMSVIPDDKNLQPQFSWSSSSIFHSLYYVLFMFVASLCSIQLFIGVFLEIFKQKSGISSLTNTQRQFQDLQRQLALVKPSRKSERPPDGSLRALCYDLVIDKRGKFAHFMATVLAANIIVFATEHLHQPEWLGHLQDVLNAICLCLYVLEMGAKIAGLGLYKWASARWNIYDMVLVWLAIFTSIPKYYGDTPFGVDTFRKLCLVGIAFRLAQRNESLDTLFRSVKRALPSIFFVSSVFFIVIICFGVAFQEEFSSTRYGPYGNEHANFRSLFNTILTLFRITTGENWIVIDNFSFTFDRRNQFTLITRSDLRNFKKAWAIFDPRATGFIDVTNVPKFLSQLEGIFSIHIYEKEHRLNTLLDASNQIDSVMGHLILIPLSDATRGNNTMGERFFNLYEFNKRLTNINPDIIKERKKQYAEEIIIAASHRGIAFHQMLEILALRLVDISKSLTFDELVNRAKLQDKIDKQLATERAKGLVNMMIQRRNYLKKRQKARNSQILKNNNNNLTMVDNWLRPGSKLSSPHRERSNPLLHFGKSNHDAQKAGSPSKKGYSTEVPKIVVDQARQQSLDSIKAADEILQKQQPSLRLPDRFATFSNGGKGLPERRNSTAITPTTLGVPPARRSSMFPQQTMSLVSSLSSSEEMMSPPKTLSRRNAALSVRRISFPSDVRGHDVSRFNDTEVLPLDDAENDAFIQYYAIDTTMDKMTSIEAKKIIEKFEHDAWSDLLRHEMSSDNEQDE